MYSQLVAIIDLQCSYIIYTYHIYGDSLESATATFPGDIARKPHTEFSNKAALFSSSHITIPWIGYMQETERKKKQTNKHTHTHTHTPHTHNPPTHTHTQTRPISTYISHPSRPSQHMYRLSNFSVTFAYFFFCNDSYWDYLGFLISQLLKYCHVSTFACMVTPNLVLVQCYKYLVYIFVCMVGTNLVLRRSYKAFQVPCL